MLREISNALRRMRPGRQESTVELKQVNVHPVPATIPSRPASEQLDARVEQSLQALIESHRRAPASRAIHPPLNEELTAGNIRIVAYGGALPSERSLRLIAKQALTHGWALLPKYQQYSEILVVNGALAAILPSDPGDWPTALLGDTPKKYVTAARDNVVRLGEILREQITATLQSRTGRPGNVVFELANVCNLACPMCPRNVRQVADGLMSAEQAKAIITDLASTGETFTFYPHYLGETLIHPKFFDVIDHALRYPNVSINVVSNGLLLDRKRQEGLLERPLKNFHFSIHECDTSQWAGVDPRRARSTTNVLDFLALAVERTVRERIVVGVSMVPGALDDPAIEVFREFWQPVVDAVNIFPAVTIDRGHSDPDFAGVAGLCLPCTSPWEQPVIAHDGTVIPCCWDYDHVMAMGNVFTSSFDDVWNGAPFEALRQAMLQGKLAAFPVCSDCQKWIDYLPSFRTVEMNDYRFSSTGTYLSYCTKRVASDRLASLREQLMPAADEAVPRHQTIRQQSSKKWIALQAK